MSPRTAKSLSQAFCSCRRPLPSAAVRHQSTSSSTSAELKSPRIVASALLSRSPLVLPPLTNFEKSYYAYQRKIHRAYNRPLDSSLEWFFKKGSAAEKSFVEFEKKVASETGTESVESAVELAKDAVSADQVPEETRVVKEDDKKSLQRKHDRTLYLLLKKNRQSNAWQFPQGGVEPGESLLEAAQRELVEETGPNMDVWAVGRTPAGAYSYPFPEEHRKTHPAHDGASVFFLPMRIVRGQAKPNESEGLVDFAWLTKEEIKETVSEDYWKAVEPILSDL